MTTSHTLRPSPTEVSPVEPSRPGRGRGRRTALAVAALLSCAVPTVFAVSITAMLVTGTENDHRFHQLTGQGLVLVALWLGALVPLVVAGWRGERPSSATAYRHVAVVLVGSVLAVFSPGGGAPALLAVVAVTGALLWAALPLRPRLRARVSLDPVLAPLALATAAVLVPYAVDQLQAQVATTTGYHAENPHLFDMAWVAGILTVLALIGAAVPRARGLFAWVGGSCTVIGAAGLALGEPVAWSAAVLVLGVLALAVPRLAVSRNRA